jgi:cytochrome P450
VSLLFDWQRNGIAALESLAQQYGDVVCVRLPGVRAYLFNGPDRIKHALIDNSDNYLKTPGSTHARMYFGDSMQLNNGEKARRLRQWITPIFHHSRVAQDLNSSPTTSWRWRSRWACKPISAQTLAKTHATSPSSFSRHC